MATLRSQASVTPEQSHSLLAEIRDFWRQFIVAAFDPYRPEEHYMRGPGPACEAKATTKAPPHQTTA